MIPTSARLLRLLSLLQQRQAWAGTELANRLEIDPRTLRRDVDKLRSLGYAVHASAGHGGGYALGSGPSMPPVLLDDDEAVTLSVALHAAGGMVGNLEPAARSLLQKLGQMLPTRLRDRATAIQAVTISLHEMGPLSDAATLTAVAAACRDHRRLRFEYSSHEGVVSRRTVEPCSLARLGHRWYLVAWDVERADWRSFRVDRIRSAEATGSTFEPSEPPGGIAAYIQQAIAIAPFEHRIRLRLSGSLGELSLRIPSWCGVLEAETTSTCILTTGADSTLGVASLAIMAGVEAELLDDPPIAAELRDIAARFARAMGIAEAIPRSGN
ncbi:helix-turn-helix transcriptional regulator [Pinirhizobacter sp.]|jgi:predicted DNA-binding transcriptional regulator YafY|uniref:helix-turn-helix transcriptional regulator n=1 Tax=Pinirhizobacter sp. TaxID=2950432 RepID=UPI002F415051